jgi:hypothetical protein
MTPEPLPTGPDSEAVIQSIRETYPDADVVQALGATFFSLDPEKHFPNFATIVTTDEHDEGAPRRHTTDSRASGRDIAAGAKHDNG